MSTLNAAGDLPSPGIVCMSPHSATSQPAPVYGRMSRTVTVNPARALGRRPVLVRSGGRSRQVPHPALRIRLRVDARSARAERVEHA